MPYSPGIQYRGDQALGQGISQAGGALRQFLGDYVERGRKSKAMDSVLTAYLPDGSDEQKQLKSALPGMSLEEKEGAVQAHAVKDYAAKQQQAQKVQNAQLAEYEALAGERKQRTAGLLREQQVADEESAGASRFGDFVKAARALETGPSLGQPSQVFTAENLAGLASEAGALTNPRVAPLLKEWLDREGRGRATEVRNRVPVAMKLAGRDVINQPETGQFQVLSDPAAEMSVKDLMNSRARLVVAKSQPLADHDTIDAQIDALDELLGDKAPKRKAAGGSAAAEAGAVTTKAQFDKLPRGAEYIGKDGRKYRKP